MTSPPALSEPGSRPPREFHAFISYRHGGKDGRWARWLHRSLENFSVPRELATSAGVRQKSGWLSRWFRVRRPPTIRPVFIDDAELGAATNLSQALLNALKASKTLIVICTPRTRENNAQGKNWVDQEVRFFSEHLKRGQRILTCLVEGEPADAVPPSLDIRLQRQDAPRAADMRTCQRPWQFWRRRKELTRLAAVLLACDFDRLWQRERNRWLYQTASLSVFGLLLTAVIGLLGGVAWTNAQRATAAISAKQEVERSLTDIEQRRKLALRDLDRIQSEATRQKQELRSLHGEIRSAKTDLTQREQAIASLEGTVSNLKGEVSTEASQRLAAETARSRAETAEELRRLTAYQNEIQLAQESIQAATYRNAALALERCPTDLRGWEWHFLYNRCHSPGTDGISASLGTVGYSQSGRWAVTVRSDVAQLFDLRGQKLVKTWVFPDRGAWLPASVALSDDAGRLAIRGVATEVWDLRQDAPQLERTVPPSTGGIALSGDGRWLAEVVPTVDNTSERDMLIVDLSTGEEAARVSKTYKSTVTFDGRVAFNGDGTKVAWWAPGGVMAFVRQGRTGRKWVAVHSERNTASCAQFIPDGRGVLLGTGPGIGLLALGPGTSTGVIQTLWQFKDKHDEVRSMAVSPEGSRLAAASTKDTIVFKLRGNRLSAQAAHLPVTTLEGAMKFIEGDEFLAIYANDHFQIWNLETKAPPSIVRGELKSSSPVRFAGTQPGTTDRDYSFVGSPATIAVFRDNQLGNSAIRAVLFIPNGVTPVCTEAGVWRWVEGRQWAEIGSGSGRRSGLEVALKLKNPSDLKRSPSVSVELLSFVSADLLQQIVDSGERISSISTTHDRKVFALGLANGDLVLDAGREGGARPETPAARVARAHSAPITALKWSWDSAFLASASADGMVRVWGRDLAPLKTEVDVRGLADIAIDHAANRLAVGRDDGRLLLIDLKTGERLLTSSGHKGGVRSVAFSPDGSRLYSGGGDMLLRVWFPKNGTEAAALLAHGQGITRVECFGDDKTSGLVLTQGTFEASPPTSGNPFSEVFIWNGGASTSKAKVE